MVSGTVVSGAVVSGAEVAGGVSGSVVAGASVAAGEMVYMPPWEPHGVRNTGTEDMHLMFAYAPKQIAEHWAQEKSGAMK